MNTRRLPLLVLLLLLPIMARAEDATTPPPLLDDYVAVETRAVAVQEISAMEALPDERAFLVVSDEGPYDPATKTVKGALFRLDLGEGEDTPDRITPITLHVTFDRFDPAWPADVSPMDLEALAALPGTKDLYLLAGERNPEDQTDEGANRLYVVRYPAPDAQTARVEAYFRLYDLPDDLMNDRFEGVAVLPVATPDGADASRTAWDVYAFKERTAFPQRAPGYVRGRLTRREGTFTLAMHGDRGYPPLMPEFVLQDNERISTQSDACVAPDGSIWILDRWRRQIHIAERTEPGGPLAYRASMDYDAVVEDIDGEHSPLEPSPPGLPHRRGYGRHEAIAFDAQHRLYLASDRGGRTSSTVTSLTRKKR